MEQAAFKRADRVVVTTELGRQYVISQHKVSPERVRVIPNYVDVELFTADGHGRRQLPGRRLVFVGRLHREKNLFHLLEALEGLDVDLVVIGEGPQFDVVTIMWTLENCASCREMLAGAYRIVREKGSLLVATGSRILVPFKKPLYCYLSKNPPDTHAFRFSANSLRGILAISQFEVTHVNCYIDYDVLCMIAAKAGPGRPIPWQGDDAREVCDFFERWHGETQTYYPKGSVEAAR
jgi:glycosyltransferase involved in cell wall biosynthesis